ncbi:hypothetical protein SEA_DELREY21_85 [Gordonia phage Delrey21]|uniref:Uncharacterized protein n=1 Tax=Gordonia phage Zipp TaxID=2591212 RepID=A0A514DHY9_9CAUD|nr:hypothetical protein J1775_gp85 [Gordonia phage Zipp]QDH93238.1 hypothetical protein SEA_ZIPP_85 [Gordonia phage Zipp]QPO16928.1 hypothetical protein SEA_DELREY21_85 [Gordonia phage Delrey21]QXN74211.1 hypothetical protein SEA_DOCTORFROGGO_85 [Gordonia phage DoctorFroggo]
MTDDRPHRGWYRLMNPLAARRPPARGSQPEVVLSTPPLPTLLINDDWRDTIRGSATIAIGTPDGIHTRVSLDRNAVTDDDPDYAVVLAHPTRLFIRPVNGRVPVIGEWMPCTPDAEIAAGQDRVGATITKATPGKKRSR